MKIMIVDDEITIRMGLAKVIRWEEFGLELLEPAASAEEALERIGTEQPDILLTDIRMSGRTGLELAEEARAVLPDLEVIILSGYDDFTYMQQAIRQNVGDYLLKTCRPEEIVKTVLKIRKRIEERRASQNRDEAGRRKEQKERFARWLVEYVPPGTAVQPPDLPELPAAFPADEPRELQIVLLAAEGWGQSGAEEALLLFAVDNMLSEMLPCLSFVYSRQVVMVAPACRNEMERQLRRTVYDRIERLLKCRLIVVGGEPVEEVYALRDSYRSAQTAYAFRALLGRTGRRRWEYADIRHRRGGRTVCTYDEEKELSTILLDNNPITLKDWVRRYVNELLDDPEATPQSVEAAIQSAVVAAERWLVRVLTATGHIDAAGEAPMRKPFKLESQPEDALFQSVYPLMKFYHDRLAEGRATHVRKAIAYIEEKIGHDLGLQQVAEHVHLHPNHLSELFKKETGVKFVDYVVRRKMEKAKEILSASPAKISEVASEVGYDDVKYFGQLFKKYTGRTPSEYREAVLRSGGQLHNRS